MKKSKLVVIMLGLALILSMSQDAFCCNECHSKNPKMVRMHQELGFKDCFTCHYPGSKKQPEEQKNQMISDDRCMRCHKK